MDHAQLTTAAAQLFDNGVRAADLDPLVPLFDALATTALPIDDVTAGLGEALGADAATVLTEKADGTDEVSARFFLLRARLTALELAARPKPG